MSNFKETNKKIEHSYGKRARSLPRDAQKSQEEPKHFFGDQRAGGAFSSGRACRTCPGKLYFSEK